MNEDHQRIWDYLRNNAVGRPRAVHIANIANDLGFAPNGTNNDDVRRFIKEMVMDHSLPIGTCQDGAFLFVNQIEREEAARFVERRTRANTIRNINFYIPN